jgi:hypothetical protein
MPKSLAVTFVLLGAILLPAAAEADIVPVVAITPQQLNVSMIEGDSTGVKVDITNTTGPAVTLLTWIRSNNPKSGDADDQVMRADDDFGKSCQSKVLAEGQSCTVTLTVFSFPLDINEDAGLGVSEILMNGTFSYGNNLQGDALQGSFDVTIYDPNSPFAPIPEPSTLALLATAMGMAGVGKCTARHARARSLLESKDSCLAN